MHSTMKKLITLTIAVFLVWGSTALAEPSHTAKRAESTPLVAGVGVTGEPVPFVGSAMAGATIEYVAGVWVAQVTQYLQAMDAALRAQAAEQAAARVRVSRSRGPSSSCAAPADDGSAPPPGFPDYIIQRESGGSPDARNGSSGAYGRAQILPSHFCSGSCQGASYNECWSKLWADGAGSSNWALTR